jgi:hypothetical protein
MLSRTNTHSRKERVLIHARHATFKIVGIAAAIYFVLIAFIACSNPKGEFFYGTLGLGDKKILISTSNAGALTVVMYDLDGHFVDVVADFTYTNDTPKGIAPFDAFNFMVLLDGADRLQKVSLKGEAEQDYTDPGLTGTLFQMAYDGVSERYFAIEGNFIESFSKSGLRAGNPLITTTTGACVLSTSRGLFATEDGRLLAVGTGNDRLSIYDVSRTTPTCISTNTGLGAIDPVGVMQHSNGSIYIADQVNDRISTLPSDGTGSLTTVWDTNLTVISNPTALLELPDGTILVASDLTNSIERITADGTRVGATPFIKDAFTGAVTQMMLIGGE